jgi:hypothetical protein
MHLRRMNVVIVAVGLVLAIAAPVAADTGPNQPTTDISRTRVPISFLGDDGRTYTGEAFFQRDNLTGSSFAIMFWSWRDLIQCDNGTPEPEDDFEGEELIDFTADNMSSMTYAIASNLSSSTGSATATARRIHTTGCEGTVVENVLETHTLSFDLAASGSASRANNRERIDNADGTITTIVTREIHRTGSGSLSLDVAGSVAPVTAADLAHITVSETTR